MATIRQAKEDKEIRRLGVNNVRQAYIDLASDYNRIVNNDILLCPKCNTWQKAETGFYFDKNYATERYPICKRCILAMVEQRKNDKDEPNENKESVMHVLQMMDRVFDEGFYDECVKGARDEVKEKNRSSPFATYITAIQSLPNWRGKTWKDSIFLDEDSQTDTSEINENSRILKAAKKRFGEEYSPQDLIFLEQEYQDWIRRYPCENKAQEVLYKNAAYVELNIEKAQKEGRDTKDLLKSLQEIMTSLQIKPSQSNSNALTEAKTFGQLIEKWEDEWNGGCPIPEVDPELKDVDKIGLYLDTFFRGHMAKMMGLKNAFSNLYERFIKKYAVEQKGYSEDADSELIFEQIFGKDGDEL